MNKEEIYKVWKEKQSHKALDFFLDDNNQIPEADQIAYIHTMSIGGSMDASLLGLSKWRNINDLYDSFFNFKKSEGKFVFDRGHVFEQFVAEQFEKVTHKKVCDGITVDGAKYKAPWSFAQIDRTLEDGTPLEIKVATFNSEDEDGKEWGTGCKLNEHGDLLIVDDCIPKAYYCQCQKQMWLTGKEAMFLACWLTSEVHIRIYLIKRNDEFIRMIRDAEEDFLFNHVIPAIPYENEGALVDEYEEDAVFGDEDALSYVDELQEINAYLSQLKKRKDEIVSILKNKLGEHEVCVDKDGKKLYSLTRFLTHRFDVDGLLNDHPEMKYYYRKIPAERLNVCKKKVD